MSIEGICRWLRCAVPASQQGVSKTGVDLLLSWLYASSFFLRRSPVPRSEKRLRSRLMFVRLTPEEHDAIRAAATRDDRTVSTWVRQMLQRALQRQERFVPQPSS